MLFAVDSWIRFGRVYPNLNVNVLLSWSITHMGNNRL